MVSASLAKRLKKKIAIFKYNRNLGILKYGKSKIVRGIIKVPQIILQKWITKI